MFNPAHKVRSEIHKSLAKLQLCPEVEFPRTFVRGNKNSYTEDKAMAEKQGFEELKNLAVQGDTTAEYQVASCLYAAV